MVLGTDKVNQHKGILTSKFESKDMLLWKRGSAFVSKDENLCYPFRLLWFDGTKPKKSLCVFKYTLPNKQQEAIWRKQYPKSQNDYL